jgi:cell division protein FtsB
VKGIEMTALEDLIKLKNESYQGSGLAIMAINELITKAEVELAELYAENVRLFAENAKLKDELSELKKNGVKNE